jgi:hypothetical protein
MQMNYVPNQKVRVPLRINNSVSRHHEAATIAEQLSERYVTFEASLSRFRCDQRKESRELSQKFDWKREIHYLKKEEKTISGSMKSSIEAVKSSLHQCAESKTNDDAKVLLRELSQVIQSLKEDCVEDEKEIAELKRVVIALRKGVNSLSTHRNDNLTVQSVPVHEKEVGESALQPDDINVSKVSVLAEMLLQCREWIELMHKNSEVEFKEVHAMTREARKDFLFLLHQDSVWRTGDSLFPSDLSNALESLIAARDGNILQEAEDMEWLQTEIITLQHELKTQLEELKMEQSLISTTNCITGNDWDNESHSIFVNVIEQRRTGAQKALAIDRLLLELPQKSKAEILNHWNWWEKRKFTKDKQKSFTDNLRKKKQNVAKAGLRSIECLWKSISIKIDQSLHKAAYDVLKESQRTRLEILRELRENAEREAMHKTDANSSLVLEFERKKQQQEVERRAADLKALTLYREERQRKLDETKNFAADEFKRASLEYDRKLPILKQRTSYRESLRLGKMQERKLELMIQYEREQERIERLDKLARSAPYYLKIKQCKADIHKTTCARKNDLYVKDDSGLADFQLNKMQNFSNERLFSNIRFKLADALFSSGVANSSYAQSIIKAMVPREPERTTGIEPF